MCVRAISEKKGRRREKNRGGGGKGGGQAVFERGRQRGGRMNLDTLVGVGRMSF